MSGRFRADVLIIVLHMSYSEYYGWQGLPYLGWTWD